MKKSLASIFILAVVLAAPTCLLAQANSTPALSKTFQPASIVNNSYKLSVNAIAISGGLWNNAYAFDKDFLFSSATTGIEGRDFFKNKKDVDKSVSAGLDIVGPSATYNLGEFGYIGFHTRFRELVNFNHLNNNIFQAFNNLDNKFWGHTFEQNKLSFSVHAFSEFGITYGKEVLNNNGHHFAAAITAKVLNGISATDLQLNKLKLNVSPDSINELRGNLHVAYSDNISHLKQAVILNPSQMLNTTGPKSLGADLGVGYEYRRDYDENYTVKMNFAITDIGRIKYKTSTKSKEFSFDIAHADLETVGRTSGQKPSAYIEQLRKNGVIDAENMLSEMYMNLPTMVRGNIDYRVSSKIFLNADIALNIAKGESRYMNSITVAPVYRSKWFSAALPFTSNSIMPLGMGMYVQAGPLQIGSSTLVSNLMGKSIAGADMYAALAWSF